jgi:hypothetical protein
MADFIITIGGQNFYVEPKETVHTECASIFTWKVDATEGDDIDIAITGFHENEFYLVGSTETSFTDSVTGLTFSADGLIISFSIQNSGNPGVFNSATLTVTNNTLPGVYVDTVTRENDTTRCSSGDLTYDELTDTPNSKVGQAGKYIKVSDDETAHEYVNAVPGDAHYVHTQAVSSASWVINHNLGKYPSILIFDGLGNTVEGDIILTDTDNLTLNFSSAFTGVAYLN